MTFLPKAFAVIVLLGLSSSAQPPHKLTVNSETEEGRLLQQIEQQSDPAKQQALLEQFVTKYPKHEAAAWVYGQLQALYLKQEQFDKALEVATQALAIDPDDLDSAYHALKASEGKKDAGLIKRSEERRV